MVKEDYFHQKMQLIQKTKWSAAALLGALCLLLLTLWVTPAVLKFIEGFPSEIRGAVTLSILAATIPLAATLISSGVVLMNTRETNKISINKARADQRLSLLDERRDTYSKFLSAVDYVCGVHRLSDEEAVKAVLDLGFQHHRIKLLSDLKIDRASDGLYNLVYTLRIKAKEKALLEQNLRLAQDADQQEISEKIRLLSKELDELDKKVEQATRNFTKLAKESILREEEAIREELLGLSKIYRKKI